MAGIGFELRKVFDQKGLFSRAKAYGYTGVIYAGPMVLGGTLIFGISYLAGYVGINLSFSDSQFFLLLCSDAFCLGYAL